MREDKLFQTAHREFDREQHILQEELESFDSVLQFSKKFLKQAKSLSVPVLAKMVNYRQQWIDKIQNLEQQRAQLNLNTEDQTSSDYLKRISQTAQKLVKIDEQIYAQLQQRKIKIVNERSNVISEAQYTHKQKAGGQGKSSKRVNIVQE